MAFCSNCGTQAEGKFCPSCGSPLGVSAPGAGAPPPGGPQGYAPPPPAQGIEDNVAAALSYIWIVAVIFLLVEPYKNNRALRFHCFQSLFFAGGAMVLWIALMILGAVLTAIAWGLGAAFGVLQMLVWLLLFIVWVYVVIKTFQREKVVLPLIGPLAEKQA